MLNCRRLQRRRAQRGRNLGGVGASNKNRRLLVVARLVRSKRFSTNRKRIHFRGRKNINMKKIKVIFKNPHGYRVGVIKERKIKHAGQF